MQTENDTSKPETELKEDTGEGCPGATCSALLDARRLVECSPRKSADPQVWWDAASAMTKHCEGLEDVTEAAARILYDRVRGAEMNEAIWEESRERMRNITRKCCDAMGVLRRGGEEQAMLAELREILLPNANVDLPDTAAQDSASTTNFLGVGCDALLCLFRNNENARTNMNDEPTMLELALEAADAGNAGHWPTVAGILAEEYRKLEAAYYSKARKITELEPHIGLEYREARLREIAANNADNETGANFYAGKRVALESLLEWLKAPTNT